MNIKNATMARIIAQRLAAADHERFRRRHQRQHGKHSRAVDGNGPIGRDGLRPNLNVLFSKLPRSYRVVRIRKYMDVLRLADSIGVVFEIGMIRR